MSKNQSANNNNEDNSRLPIFFHYENIAFELNDTLLYSAWINAIIEQEKHVLSLLNFIFCSDDYLLHINQSYLDHDTYTDIITFPYATSPQIEGDVFISIDRIRENAIQFKVTFEEELQRVMAHGVLHLCGYGDKTEEEKLVMRAKESSAIALFSNFSN